MVILLAVYCPVAMRSADARQPCASVDDAKALSESINREPLSIDTPSLGSLTR